MAPRRVIGTGILIAWALVPTGCATLDRERHSLIFRPLAHRYRGLTETERRELELFEQTRITKGPSAFGDSVGGAAFKPFHYCHRHQSYHIPESIAAVGLAPVELPAAIGTQMAAIAVVGVYQLPGRLAGWATGVWESVFPPPPPPPPAPPDEPGRRTRS